MLRQTEFKKQRSRSLYKPFTLIELLVVVAIISIWASLLRPSLGKARKKALATVCKNQLRQIHLSMTMFEDDNDQYLPYARMDNPRVRSKPWHWSLAPYLGVKQKEGTFDREVEVNLDRNIYKCPSNDTIYDYGNDISITGYAMPAYAGYGLAMANDDRYKPVQVSNVSSPSDALLLGETSQYMFNSGYFQGDGENYHLGRWHRLFLDGSLGNGIKNQGFSGPGPYWYQWSYQNGQ